MRTLTPDKNGNRSSHADFTAPQLGIYSQRDRTDSKEKLKFNQLVDDGAKKLK